MKLFSRMLLSIFLVLVISACATDSAKKPDGAAGQTSGEDAMVQGAAEEGSVTGQQLATDEGGRPTIMRVHFEFDSSSIDSNNRETLEAHAAYLIANPDIKLKLEGHCDERGTREYNLALGERRAKAVSQMLAVLGVNRNRLSTTSYGEEKPADPAHNESAWKVNRRVEIIY